MCKYTLPGIQSFSSDFKVWAGNRIDSYESSYLENQHGERVYSNHPNTIWFRNDVPLYHIEKPNLTEINNLPSDLINPVDKYFSYRGQTKYKYRFADKPGMCKRTALSVARKLVSRKSQTTT